jgi:hypothetical protein
LICEHLIHDRDPLFSQPVLERMKALRAEGLGFARIAAKLNEEGIPPRSGAKWHNFAVNQILSREN